MKSTSYLRRVARHAALAAAAAGLVFSAAPAFAAPPPASPAQPPAASSSNAAILARVTDYLNSIKTVTARFVQVAQDGSIRNGQAILQRPGKMRFQYDPPDPQLLVAGFGLLVFHDPQLNQTTNIPLSSTPLGMLLAKHVRLSGPVTVTKLAEPPGEVQVTLIRTGKPQQGHLTLVFSTHPLELRQWQVTDAQGRTTQVTLYNLHATKPFPNKDFEYVAGFTPNSG